MTKQLGIEVLTMTRTQHCVHCLIVALFVGCAFPALGLAQKQLSDKDLFKKAETESAAGKLDDAYASITSGRTLKKKPDKKYDELFGKIGQQLADREAAKGEQACRS